jgi:hypothetical protein
MFFDNIHADEAENTAPGRGGKLARYCLGASPGNKY